MNRLRKIFILMFVLIFSITLFSKDKVALSIKSRGDTRVKGGDEEKYKNKLKVGASLYSEDKIKTYKDGYAVIIFLDDKSQLKIREDSEMEIAGKIKGNVISKQITMDFGTLKANVNPQKKGEFIIATPTSVASVKGTGFWMVVDPLTGDSIFCEEGEVEVVNNESGEVIVVSGDQTGTSTPDGNVGVEDTEEGSAPTDEEDDGVGDGDSDGNGEEGTDGGTEESGGDSEPGEEETSTIRIEFQNNDGEIKTLRIEYK